MKTKNYLTTLIAGLSLIAIPCAEAQGKGKGKSKGKPSTSQKAKPAKPSKAPGPGTKNKAKGPADKGGPKHSDKNDWRKVSKFQDKDRDSIVSFWGNYKDNDKGLPPGLAKNLRRGKSLPPGWDKKIRNGWIVEDDFWGLFDRVPSSYLPKGFKLPKDTGMFLYGNRMIRVHEPTKEVIDFVRIPSIKL